PASPSISALSLHDALPISDDAVVLRATDRFRLHTVPVPATTELIESWGDAPHGLPAKVAQDAGKILQGDQCTLTVHQYPEVDGKDRKSTRLNSSHVSISYA